MSAYENFGGFAASYLVEQRKTLAQSGLAFTPEGKKLWQANKTLCKQLTSVYEELVRRDN